MRFVTNPSLTEKKPEKIKLDSKDEKIIMMLCKDGRTPAKKIAREIGLSRDAVKYRIRRLRERGAIFRPRTIVDISKLGYNSYHIFLKLSNPDIGAESRIIRSITALPYVRALLKLNGTYDFEIALIAKNISDFDGMMTEVMGIVDKYAQETEVLIVTKYFRSSDLPYIMDDAEHVKQKRKEEYTPDGKDMKIIKAMSTDADMSLLEVSKSVGISPDAVRYRLRRMEGTVIAGYQTPVNHEALGYDVHVVMMNVVGLDAEKERMLGTFFERNPNIMFAVKTVGKYNVLIYTCTKRELDLYGTITGLRSLMPEKIRSYEYMQAFAKYKYVYAPDCLFEGSAPKPRK